MEPLLGTGDLAIARAEPLYSIGDLVVFRVQSGGRAGLVIHRIVAGSAATGWTTQGDNRKEPDPWLLPNSSITGRFLLAVPGFGSYLSWVGGHAIVFASGCAAAVLLVCLPWRRRRLSPVLVAALAGATRESRRQGRTPGEYAALGVAGVASLAALGVVGLLAATHQLTTARGAVGLVALGWSAGCLLFLVLRLFDGRGLPEPTRSLYALSGRLRRVERFPALEEAPAEVVSAVALRAVAERDRLPVLHVADPSGRSHEFLVVTARRGSYRWCCQVDAGTA